MKAPWFLQLLGTLAMVPVFTISYVFHLQSTSPGSHTERVRIAHSSTAIAKNAPSFGVRLRPLTFIYSGMGATANTSMTAPMEKFHLNPDYRNVGASK